MINHLASTALLLGLSALLCGCRSTTSDTKEAPSSVVWVEQGIAHEGAKISLGYRGNPARSWIEPVASITRDGEPVANAMVFNSLVSVDDGEVPGHEAATLYEPPAGKEPALYAQGKLQPPPAAPLCVVRFRIVLPEGEQEFQRDIDVPRIE